MFRKYLLSSVARFPQDDAGGDTPEDERIEVADDDDETVADPVEAADDDGADDTTETADADAEDGDAADDADSGDADDAPPQRGSRQFGELRAERRRLAEENARLTRQLDDVRRQPIQPAETPQQKADRLAVLTPEERIREEMRESLDRNERNTQAVIFRLSDQSDKNAFDSEVERNPLARKLANRVEQELANIRTKGQDLPRKVILAQLVGLQVLSQQGKAKPAAQQRRRAQETRPANGRGDAPSGRRERRGGDTAADLERRFGDVPI